MSDFDDMLAREEHQQFGAGKEPGEQGSVEWIMQRVGYCTASRFADVLDKLKNGTSSAKRTNYLMEVISERMTGKPIDHYVNAAMEWGTLNEPLATMAYESLTGAMVTQPGFTHHQTVPMCGGSIDGLAGDDGIIEIKAPTTQTHIKTLLAKSCEHLPQIMGYLWITGRKWCDFISYDPRMPPALQLYVQRIERDDTYIAHLAAEVEVFLSEVAAMQAKLQEAA